MATAAGAVRQKPGPLQILLNIGDLHEVVQLLKRYHFTTARYHPLGLSLGLYNDTLKEIEKDYKGDGIGRCLSETFAAWLRKADNVESKGDPSYYTLIAALRAIGENAVADGIDREKHPACVILAHHQSDQSLQDSLPSLVLLLHKEGIIGEMILPATRGTDVMLTAVQDAVCLNHENLEKFAAILRQCTATVSVGQAILKDYWKEFPDDSVEAVDEKGRSLKIHVPRSMTADFKGMRAKWTDMMLDVYEVVSVSKEDLELYLETRRPDLKPQLANCRTAQNILKLISERCSLIDVSLLEGVVTRFKIEEAKSLIEKYKESVKEFCQTMRLHQCLDEKLSTAPILHCQKIVFLVDRTVDEYTLKDIDDLVTLAFEDKREVEIVQVKTGNSFTFTCSFPLTLSESLIASALKNLELLIKKKGLLQLTIGYSTVYSTHDEMEEISDEVKAKKSIISSSEWVTAVYTSRGTLEQLLVSQTVQLVNREYELATMELELTSLNEEMIKYQAKLTKEILSLQEKQREMKDQLVIMEQKHREELTSFNEMIPTGQQLAGESEAEKEVMRLQEEIELQAEQLALFISEKDTVTKQDTDRQSVEEKEREIEHLKLSLDEKEKEIKTSLKELKESKDQLTKQLEEERKLSSKKISEAQRLKVELDIQTEKLFEIKKPEIEKVFRGTVFHCLSPENVEVLNDAVVGVYKSGKIAFVGEGCDLEQLKKDFEFKDWSVRQLSSSQFLMPGFVDTHTHAPQYGLLSVTDDEDLESWLKKCVFPREKEFADISFATQYYSQVVRHTLTNGTTTASYYATIHLESTKELCKIIAKSGQRALVGKVNMDANSPSDYIESTKKSIEDTVEFVKFVKDMNVPLIQAVITPRHLPSCSGELLRRLAQIANNSSLCIQSILCEEEGETDYSLNCHPGHNNCTEILDEAKLLTEKTYMAHCIHLRKGELELLKERNVGIAHCSSSNLNLRCGVMDSLDILSRGIKIGLGTDIPNKSSSILRAIRDARTASGTIRTGGTRDKRRHLTLDDAFYMATLGGAQVLNLDKDIGNFQVGKQFDALIVDQDTDKTSKDLLAEFLFINGKENNIIEVYVAGRAVKILL